jgi:hypothetical protein
MPRRTVEQRDTIVGEAIGGSHHSITAGTDITYQLPHTGIKATVPLMLINFSDELYKKVPEMYIIPDVELSEETYYNYFLLQQDPELETVFELIGRGE